MKNRLLEKLKICICATLIALGSGAVIADDPPEPPPRGSGPPDALITCTTCLGSSDAASAAEGHIQDVQWARVYNPGTAESWEVHAKDGWIFNSYFQILHLPAVEVAVVAEWVAPAQVGTVLTTALSGTPTVSTTIKVLAEESKPSK